MILNRLSLTNFGVYRGQHEFDLRPQASRPIVIFGGKNGAGKTTLLDAIRLCLYGSLILDDPRQRAMKDSDYERYLRERIHHSPDAVIPLDWASLELEFEYAIGGERQTYTVARSWKSNGASPAGAVQGGTSLGTPGGQGRKRVEETLHVLQDHQPLDKLDARQWEDFIRDLIPPGLAQLVFFDGERMQSLSTGRSPAASASRITLSQTIKSLLGLNLVEQLQTDLGVYRRRQQRGNRVEAAEQRIEALENELMQLRAEEEDLLAQVETVTQQMSAVEAQIRLQEAEIARVGGGFAQQREAYKAAQIRLKAEIEVTEGAMRDLCAGLLPFAITPAYTEAVKTQLIREADYKQWLASRKFIEGKLSDIQAEIESPAFWQGTGAEALIALQRTIGERVVETLQSMVEPPEAVRDVTLRHHASEPERRQLLGWIEESQTTIPEQLRQLAARLTRLKEDHRETESALQRVPADDVLGPLMETLNEYHQELGALAQQQSQFEEALHRLELQREDLKRELHKVREDKAARQKLAEKVGRVVDVQLAMDDFAGQLVRLRVSQLEEAFTRGFNQLCRKERLIQRAQIDPHDFSVTLVGADEEPIPHGDLSAGETQIYAIALLWALRQVSGRPLPVVIDAPLGRLDSDHRQNLVERYFPRASQQVILLSTDTEVDAEFYAAMQGSISHAYHLDYDQVQKTTRVSQGYFWGSN
jgi:DNA sulfur modification protein DndD